MGPWVWVRSLWPHFMTGSFVALAGASVVTQSPFDHVAQAIKDFAMLPQYDWLRIAIGFLGGFYAVARTGIAIYMDWRRVHIWTKAPGVNFELATRIAQDHIISIEREREGDRRQYQHEIKELREQIARLEHLEAKAEKAGPGRAEVTEDGLQE